MKKSIISQEILEEIQKSKTAHLKDELMCRKENLCEEPCCAEDPEYVAITQAIEEELRSRGAW